MDLLGLLSEATSRITQLLRGGAPISLGSRIQMAIPAPAAGDNGHDAPAAAPALDRILEYEKPEAGEMEEASAPKRRGRRGKLNIEEAELKKLYIDQGLTAKEIGEKFGVAPGTVAQRVMKLGLSKRGPSPAKGKKRN